MEKTMTSHVTQVGASTAQLDAAVFQKFPDFHSPLPFPAHGVPIRSRHVKKPKPLEMLKDFTVPLKTCRGFFPAKLPGGCRGFFSKTSLEVEPV